MTDEYGAEVVSPPVAEVAPETAPVVVEADHKSMLARLIARLETVAVGLDHELNDLVAKAKEIL